MQVDLNELSNQVKSFEDRQAQLMKELADSAEPIIRAGLKGFFDQFPEVRTLMWHQYTPYFNDGEECVFRVREVSVKVEGKSDAEYEDDDYEWDTSWTFRDTNKALSQGLQSLNAQLKKLEGILQKVFGDHAKIIATREKITIEAYDHE